MRYFFAIVLPPVAVLSCGKPFQAILNLVLTLCTMWIGGIIHAFFVVNAYYNKRNTDRIEQAIIASSRVAHKDTTHNHKP